MKDAYEAAIFAAVEIVQRRSSRSRSVFWGDVFDKAADGLLDKLAKSAPTVILDPKILAPNAVADAKKVVRARQAKRETDAESERVILGIHDPANAADVRDIDIQLDLLILLGYATRSERDVLTWRLAGTPTKAISETLGIALVVRQSSIDG
jgi:hypothetical protein